MSQQGEKQGASVQVTGWTGMTGISHQTERQSVWSRAVDLPSIVTLQVRLKQLYLLIFPGQSRYKAQGTPLAYPPHTLSQIIVHCRYLLVDTISNAICHMPYDAGSALRSPYTSGTTSGTTCYYHSRGNLTLTIFMEVSKGIKS